jgi:predicted dehydrogenase
MRFASGAIGSVHVDYNLQPPSHRLEITGSQGSMQWDNGDGTLRVYRVETKSWEIFSPSKGFERNTLFIDEIRHFLRVARREEEPLCTLQDGKKVLELALAAKESGKNKQFIQFDK